MTDIETCVCGHRQEEHQGSERLGGAQCLRCPGDTERSWRHPYTPTTKTEDML